MRLVRLLPTTACLALLAACGGGGSTPTLPTEVEANVHPMFSEENAYADLTELGADAPATVTPETFVERVESGDYRLVTRRGNEAAADAEAAQAEQDYLEAVQRFANTPGAMQWIDLQEPQGNPDLQALPDGNVMFRALPGDPDNNVDPQWVQLGGRHVGIRTALNASKSFETLANHRDIYSEIFANLPESYIQEMQLPTPESVANENVEFFRLLNLEIASDWLQFLPQNGPSLPPAGWPQSWEEEEGAGVLDIPNPGLDRSGREGLPTGLWTQIDYPLKWCATHVRAQGSRGLCAFFAVTAAVEARYAAQRGRWVNLSEQTLYNQTKRVWDYNTDHGEAGWPSAEMARMRDRGFTYPFEREWEYNQSWQRINDLDRRRYFQSCWADPTGATRYPGPYCSDTNHQSPGIRVHAAGRVFYATRDPGPDLGMPTGSSGIGVRRWVTVSDSSVGINHRLAKLFLAFKMPITFCIRVPTAGFNRADGILQLATPEPGIAGSHCMVLLGYVRNADLPAGVPPGPGGGYYVGKNSWGSNWGDGGYFYASDDWVDKYCDGMYAVTSVSG